MIAHLFAAAGRDYSGGKVRENFVTPGNGKFVDQPGKLVAQMFYSPQCSYRLVIQWTHGPPEHLVVFVAFAGLMNKKQAAAGGFDFHTVGEDTGSETYRRVPCITALNYSLSAVVCDVDIHNIAGGFGRDYESYFGCLLDDALADYGTAVNDSAWLQD